MARPKKGDIAGRVLAAARKRFLTDGVDGTSLRDIAADAKTSIGMIYYYFPTKDDLFLAVVDKTYTGLLDGLRAALAPGGTVAERVHRLYVRIGAASDEEVQIIQIVVREMLTSPARRGVLFQRFMVGHVPLVLGLVAEGAASGELSARHGVPATGLVLGVTAIFPQLVRRLVGDDLPIPVPAGEDLAHALADLVLGGVGAARPPR